MNFLERTLGAIAPGWALSRAQARAALHEYMRAADRRTRAYDAAKTGRRGGNWIAGSGSANAEMQLALSRVRNRSRDLIRNNPYASSAIDKLCARSVGTGIMARWPNKQVLGVWKEFVDNADYEGQLDLYGLQSLMCRTVYESGEVLVRRIRTRNLKAPLQIQVLEPDYLDPLQFGPQPNGNFIINGVEIDRTGRRVAYWLYEQHPGEIVQMPKSWLSKRVDASEVIHIYEKKRPGQLRGMPRLAVAMLRLRDVDEYQDAVIMRKKIEACFAAFVTSPATARPIADAAGVSKDDAGRRIEQLAPGMVWYGNQGEEVTFGNPTGGVRDEYTNDQLHAIAAGIGTTYEQMTGDYSQVTYLSARAARLDFQELIETFQWVYFIPMGCRGIAGWFADAYYTAGRLRADAYKTDWTTPRWPWIDPLKDTMALKQEIRGGLGSLSAALRSLGIDFDEWLAERTGELSKLKAANVVVDTDAAAVANLTSTGNINEKGNAPAAAGGVQEE